MSATRSMHRRPNALRVTPSTLAVRLRAVSEAYRERDEDSLRAELRLLSTEAKLLAALKPMPMPPPPDLITQRQAIRAEARTLGATTA